MNTGEEKINDTAQDVLLLITVKNTRHSVELIVFHSSSS